MALRLSKPAKVPTQVENVYITYRNTYIHIHIQMIDCLLD